MLFLQPADDPVKLFAVNITQHRSVQESFWVGKVPRLHGHSPDIRTDWT